MTYVYYVYSKDYLTFKDCMLFEANKQNNPLKPYYADGHNNLVVFSSYLNPITVYKTLGSQLPHGFEISRLKEMDNKNSKAWKIDNRSCNCYINDDTIGIVEITNQNSLEIVEDNIGEYNRYTPDNPYPWNNISIFRINDITSMLRFRVLAKRDNIICEIKDV